MTDRPFDPGLQPERTELAWRRTNLSIAIGSLVALRLLPEVFGSVFWVVPGVTGLIGAGVMWVLARRRYRTVHTTTTTHGDHAQLPGGALMLMISAFVLVGGLFGLVTVLIVGIGRLAPG